MTKPNSPGHQNNQREPSRRFGRSDDGEAFIPDPGEGPARSNDPLAQELAEEFLASATSGDHVAEEELNKIVPEENGGPFIVSSPQDEFAYDEDESNPDDAEPEGLPSPMRGDSN